MQNTRSIISRQALPALLQRFPRVEISVLPTPFRRLNRLSELLGYNLFIKRDDLTGFAFGGNKTRKLDFLIAEALATGCDTIIGMGANQSNFCRILANAGVKFGLEIHLVLRGSLPQVPTGNLLIDHLLGVHIHHIATNDNNLFHSAAMQIRQDLEKQGRRVFFLPPGGSVPIGALGYVAGFRELVADLKHSKIRADYIIHASSSAGTQAGLIVGQASTDWPGKIIGMSVDVPRNELRQNVLQLAEQTAGLLNLQISPELIAVDDQYIGDGYGIPTEGCREAVNLFARYEGIYLDYVYTGKAAAGLIDYCRHQQFPADAKIVFLHTGGNVELFA